MAGHTFSGTLSALTPIQSTSTHPVLPVSDANREKKRRLAQVVFAARVSADEEQSRFLPERAPGPADGGQNRGTGLPVDQE